ncbi:MAG: HAD family hydrolase [Defluviitaleaceae bacterium]|nr:HAD family hydrolase [Defluviitaleaceae bacterium]
MREIDCVVCDLDGTLVDNTHSMSDKDKDALKALHKQGVKIILATARHYTYIREYIDALGLFGLTCTSGGGMIYDYADEEAVKIWNLPHKELNEIIAYGLKHGLPMIAHKKDQMYITFENPRIKFFQRYNARQSNPGFKVPFKVVDFKSLSPDGIFKFSVVNEPGKQDLSQFDWLLRQNSLNIDPSSEELIDFTVRDASKGAALEYLSDFLGFDLNRTVVFGDSENDISMFKVAGIKIAMGNAVDRLKQRADFITLRSGQSGIWHTLVNQLKVLYSVFS